MPNLDPSTIIQLNQYIQGGTCDIATLGSQLKMREKFKIKTL